MEQRRIIFYRTTDDKCPVEDLDFPWFSGQALKKSLK